MLTIRAAQMAVLAKVAESGLEDRAVSHLRSCIPEVCASMTEGELREVIRWGRKRARRYGIEREYDFFRYLNLMFMFGFEFDTDPQYSWGARVLNKPGMHPAARMDLLMDHALLYCSTQGREQRT